MSVTNTVWGGCEAALTQEVPSQMSGHAALHLCKKTPSEQMDSHLLVVWVKEIARKREAVVFCIRSFNSDWTSLLSLCELSEETGSWGIPTGWANMKCMQDMYTRWLDFLLYTDIMDFCHLKRSNVIILLKYHHHIVFCTFFLTSSRLYSCEEAESYFVSSLFYPIYCWCHHKGMIPNIFSWTI